MIRDDIQKFRRPLETGSSFYCMYSGLINLGSPALGLGSVLFDPHREAALKHELTHWHTHTLSSVGLLLSYLHHCRMSAVIQVATMEELRRPLFDYRDETVRTFTLDDSGRRKQPSMREWLQMGYDQALFANKIVLLFSQSPLNLEIKETPKPENFPLLPLAWALAGADAYDRGNPHELDVILQLAKLLFSENFYPTFGAEVLDTDGLFEAYSFIIEILTLREFVPLRVLQSRFSSVKDTHYGLPLRIYFRKVHKELTITNLITHAAILLMLIEIALDPPIPPKYILYRDNIAWARVYPPSRFVIITDLFAAQFAANIDVIHTDSLDSRTYADFADSFLAAIDKKRELRRSLMDRARYDQFCRSLIARDEFVSGPRIELIFATAQLFRSIIERERYRTLSQYLLLCENRPSIFESAPCIITCDGEAKVSSAWPKRIGHSWWAGGMELYIQDDIGVGTGPIDVLPFTSPKLKAQAWYKELCHIATAFADRGMLFNFHGLVK